MRTPLPRMLLKLRAMPLLPLVMQPPLLATPLLPQAKLLLPLLLQKPLRLLLKRRSSNHC